MKYTVCVPMDEELQNALIKGLKQYPFTKDDEIDFVHIFKEEQYNYILPPVIYPVPEQRDTIRESVLEIMKEVESKVSSLCETKPNFHCLFHLEPKDSMVDYLKETNPDLTFVATRGKNGIAGLFSSSFAEHLLKFSPSSVYVIR